MAQIINASINVDNIDSKKLFKGKKGRYLNITITVNDNPDNYGNTTSISIAQTKEERESKAPKVYLGNGKTVWNNVSSVSVNSNQTSEDLPF